MGFIMEGLDAEAYDRNYTDRDLVKRIGGYFKPHMRSMGLVTGMVILNALMETALPIIVSFGIDSLVPDLNLGVLIFYSGILLVSGGLAWTFNYIRQWFTARIVGEVVLQLRSDTFQAVLNRDMSFFDVYASGKIVSRVTSDSQDFATVVTLTLNLMSQVLLVILITAYLFTIDTALAWLTVGLAPIVVAIALGFRRLARETTQRAQRALARVNASVQETISGISVAKSFRQEQAVYDSFSDVNEQSYRVTLRQGFVFSAIFPVLIFVAGLGTVALVYFGGLSTINTRVTPGNWFLFIQAIGIFWFPLTSIASFWSQFQQGLSASERVFALIDAEPQVVQTAHQAVPPIKGDIEFSDVDFRYTAEERVLQGFTLHIPAGETIALVGHTGAGKSSLGKLVARFYEFQAGELHIDGHDIRNFDLNDYRLQLGVVPQTPFLFSGTVAENIRYARQDSDDAAVEAVARRIGWGEWLDALPEGLATPVSEGGRGLSMGQRQLIALARVLLEDPAILILDEATASIDPVTEAQIQESLDIVLEDRTAIVIAHRLSTIRNADRIIVLDQGQIVEEGTHDDLMDRGGEYAELYNTYFRHQAADYVPGA